jgi:hypothetical protein
MCSVCTLVPVTRYSLTRMIMMRKLLLDCMIITHVCMYVTVVRVYTCMYYLCALAISVLTVLECHNIVLNIITCTCVHVVVRKPH